jgi:hypothetical protein
MKRTGTVDKSLAGEPAMKAPGAMSAYLIAGKDARS